MAAEIYAAQINIERYSQQESKAAMRRRRTESGQSLIVAVIVLFLLLIIGAAFVALIGQNLRNARTSTRRQSSNYYAEAGIRYMDQQLTTSPQGADWRPVADCLPDTTVAPINYDVCFNNTAITNSDPDWTWIKPYNPNTGQGGYTRVAFSSDVPGNPGGRALVKVTYRPYRAVFTGGGVRYYDPGDPNCANPTTPACQNSDATGPSNVEAGKYIKLDSIGRVGTIDPKDPTTYKNSQAPTLRRELVAYKQIGLTDYLRFIHNKDNRPTTAALGSNVQPFDVATAPNPAGTPAPPSQIDIPSTWVGGGIYANAPITFYGLNSIYLDPNKGDALQAAGPIALNGVASNAKPGDFAGATPTYGVAGNPGRVSVYDITAGAPTANPVVPSTSSFFDTYGGLVRDNPAGSNTSGLVDASNAQNLRSIPRAAAPVLDTATADGVTRYRALTRDSAPLSDKDLGGPGKLTKNAFTNPGMYGWGQNLYLNNHDDVQKPSSLTNLYSLRSDWLNPGANGGYWKTDGLYVPPGITITLTPRYIIMTRSGDQVNTINNYQDRFRFSRQDGSDINETTVIRYTTDTAGAMANPPFQGKTVSVAGQNVLESNKFAGYPASNFDPANPRVPLAYYRGNYVINAEGNIRIRGVVGGLDSETGQYFLRHLTVVSGGTIYVEGNLLRDNITPNMASGGGAAAAVKGKSSIALLAHDYVAVNTSQFLAAQTGFVAPKETSDPISPSAIALDTSNLQYAFDLTFGPVDDDNTVPTYVPSIYLRHAAAGAQTDSSASINLLINRTADPTYNQFQFPPTLSTTLTLNSAGNAGSLPTFYDQVYSMAGATTFLFGSPGQTYPYGAVPPAIGTPNDLRINYDVSASGAVNPQDYYLTRLGVTPLDIRVEAILYAQEGSFFIIPGPWFNPDSRDSYANYSTNDPNNPYFEKRPGNPGGDANKVGTEPAYPFYGQPQDIRMTFYGSITENLPAEVSDQTSWLEKWGWVPRYQGSTGLPVDAGGYPDNGPTPQPTVHGPLGPLSQYVFYKNLYNGGSGVSLAAGGIVYQYDPRASSPYDSNGVALRTDSDGNVLPITPCLPVAPGLVYEGEQPVQSSNGP